MVPPDNPLGQIGSTLGGALRGQMAERALGSLEYQRKRYSQSMQVSNPFANMFRGSPFEYDEKPKTFINELRIEIDNWLNIK